MSSSLDGAYVHPPPSDASGGVTSLIHGHATTWHDGGVAMLLPNGRIVALAAERVGDRYKHSWDSRLAYDYLRNHLGPSAGFGGDHDHFVHEAAARETTNHHLYHAASAFFGSGFTEAAILVADGQGPEAGGLATTSIWVGAGRDLSLVELLHAANGSFAPQSLGHFYTAVGALAGMKHLYEEGKTMALAAYGRPSRFLEFLRRFAHTNDDGTYHLDPQLIYAILGNTLGPAYYDWAPQPSHIQQVWAEAIALREVPRSHDQGPTQDDMDIAFAGQLILEEILLGLAHRIRRLTKLPRLCFAGGVALNCVANGWLLKEAPFDDLYIPPAPGDDGQAIGKLYLDIKRLGLQVDTSMSTAYYGPAYPRAAVDAALTALPGILTPLPLVGEAVIDEVVGRLIRGEVIGWYQGRSELGPRALGHRSILADPRRPELREYINSEVKGREWYRPLAPIVLEAHASEYFDLARPSPFMSFAVSVRPDKREQIPAVTHVDGTARVQTINRAQDERCHELISRFRNRTGVPLLLNTSFNRRGEPLVETPADATRAFAQMRLDALMLEDTLIVKA